MRRDGSLHGRDSSQGTGGTFPGCYCAAHRASAQQAIAVLIKPRTSECGPAGETASPLKRGGTSNRALPGQPSGRYASMSQATSASVSRKSTFRDSMANDNQRAFSNPVPCGDAAERHCVNLLRTFGFKPPVRSRNWTDQSAAYASVAHQKDVQSPSALWALTTAERVR